MRDQRTFIPLFSLKHLFFKVMWTSVPLFTEIWHVFEEFLINNGKDVRQKLKITIFRDIAEQMSA
ncbi:hypothetical protein GI584_16205 [Gracilibacillus salitolerans]|uniref:Uncharacterized protein n=1 Tax=Gracilibacillus salitolerans TaxID=2663022 RepID=A0A5Q2TRU1_9BACI|nr:hypothetical protein GI584_16205 [Gracilibacillus salitolerans]